MGDLPLDSSTMGDTGTRGKHSRRRPYHSLLPWGLPHYGRVEEARRQRRERSSLRHPTGLFSYTRRAVISSQSAVSKEVPTAGVVPVLPPSPGPRFPPTFSRWNFHNLFPDKLKKVRSSNTATVFKVQTDPRFYIPKLPCLILLRNTWHVLRFEFGRKRALGG